MTSDYIKELFKPYTADFIYKFISICLGSPENKPYNKFYAIRSSEDFVLYVWAKDDQELIDQFERFVGLKLFI